jgi:hypothetical protein
LMKATKNYTYKEESYYPLWQSFCDSRQHTRDKILHGTFAGKMNRFDGPDFQGAEFKLNGIVYRGDVEIHHNRKDWYAHGHHLDIRYDRVVLHLVWNLDGRGDCFVHNSKNLPVPTLSLQEFPFIRHIEDPAVHCHLYKKKKNEFEFRLKKIALSRLAEKARRFQSLIQTCSYDQAIYLMMLRILGMPQNSDNFERLALLIPWDKIQFFKRKNHQFIEYMLALFLVISGLIEKKSCFRVLKKYESLLKPIMIQQTMSFEVWKLAGQRPANNPIIRLASIAHFVYQFQCNSIYRLVRDLFMARLSFNTLYQELCRLLSPYPSNYWCLICDEGFLKPDKFWGSSVQTEIIGNIFVPIFYREALGTKSYGFASYLEEFYLHLPASNKYARLRAYEQWKELVPAIKRYFYCNQALLLIQNYYCLKHMCKYCPLGRICQDD